MEEKDLFGNSTIFIVHKCEKKTGFRGLKEKNRIVDKKRTNFIRIPTRMHILCRTIVPGPHEVLHELNSDQAPQIPSPLQGPESHIRTSMFFSEFGIIGSKR